MTLFKRPLGVWILVAWCALQAAAGFVIAFDSSGLRGLAAWGFALVQVVFLAGLALPLALTHRFMIAYLAMKVFAVAIAGWAIVFVAAAWGLRHTDLPLVVPIAVYQVFIGWAFIYLFHPDVQAYLRGYVNAPSD